MSRITLTVGSRLPLLGSLVVPDDDPTKASVQRTALGDALFDACAAGRLLILSPWSYDSGKRHISRADCVALNAMAEEIANSLTGEV